MNNQQRRFSQPSKRFVEAGGRAFLCRQWGLLDVPRRSNSTDSSILVFTMAQSDNCVFNITSQGGTSSWAVCGVNWNKNLRFNFCCVLRLSTLVALPLQTTFYPTTELKFKLSNKTSFINSCRQPRWRHSSSVVCYRIYPYHPCPINHNPNEPARSLRPSQEGANSTIVMWNRSSIL